LFSFDTTSIYSATDLAKRTLRGDAGGGNSVPSDGIGRAWGWQGWQSHPPSAAQFEDSLGTASEIMDSTRWEERWLVWQHPGWFGNRGWLVWQHLPAGLATGGGWFGNRIRSIVAEA
jgi:hypothetical protein